VKKNTRQKIAVVTVVALVVLWIVWKFWGEGAYNHYFIYQPVGFHRLGTPFTFDHKGIELGNYDGVSFYLFGHWEENSDGTKEEYCAIAQMRIPKGVDSEDFLSALPRFAQVEKNREL
jgi:hypothetical protein